MVWRDFQAGIGGESYQGVWGIVSSAAGDSAHPAELI